MKILGIKALAGCILLVCLVMISSAQTTAKTTVAGEKKAAKLDKTKVPKEVINSFTNEFPILAPVDWYAYPAIDNQSDWYEYDPYRSSDLYPESYEVEFVKENVPCKAIYDKTGKKTAIHKTLISDLPQAVLTAISGSKYKGWVSGKDKEEIFRDKDSDQLKVYKVDVMKGNEKHTLYFEIDGKLLRDTKVS